MDLVPGTPDAAAIESLCRAAKDLDVDQRGKY
jgi:hypothetical protein